MGELNQSTMHSTTSSLLPSAEKNKCIWKDEDRHCPIKNNSNSLNLLVHNADQTNLRTTGTTNGLGLHFTSRPSRSMERLHAVMATIHFVSMTRNWYLNQKKKQDKD